jgi:hypothetical protein
MKRRDDVLLLLLPKGLISAMKTESLLLLTRIAVSTLENNEYNG